MTRTTGITLEVTEEPIVLDGSQHVDIRAVFCILPRWLFDITADGAERFAQEMRAADAARAAPMPAVNPERLAVARRMAVSLPMSAEAVYFSLLRTGDDEDKAREALVAAARSGVPLEFFLPPQK